MVPRVGKPSTAPRVAIAFAILAALAGCGSTMRGGVSVRASADDLRTRAVSGACSRTVLGALGGVVMRAYREGVSSERTRSALSLIAHSIPLREAVERGDARATQTAAQALIATGHMTNLRVTRGGEVLADVGAADALAPLRGTITSASGATIATFTASVWADSGFVAEASGIAEGLTALRESGRSIAGSLALGASEPPAQGTLTVKDVTYAYTSFPAAAYPSGRLRVYVLKSVSSVAPLCGKTSQETLVNTLSRVARLIYTSEQGAHALTQVRRVQSYQPLLRAVAADDSAGSRRAVEHLLHEHVVRLRVSGRGGRLLSDVGGPYVLAPVHAPLRLNGRRIGSIELSIQDDEGYKRLAERLAGLDVLMYMGSRLVKNSLGPAPGNVPAHGTYNYRGRRFRVFTLHAEAFPSGPLRIVVLVPIPYS